MKKMIIELLLLLVSVGTFAQTTGGQITRKNTSTTTQPNVTNKQTHNSKRRLAQQKRAAQSQAERERREREELERAEQDYRDHLNEEKLKEERSRKQQEDSLQELEKQWSASFVNLGLPSGTLWATCNIGAVSPEDDGLYFRWGETTGYRSRAFRGDPKWVEYKFKKGESVKKFLKYNNNKLNGRVDNKTELDLEDDAAFTSLGISWRIPSIEQIKELMNCCKWVWTNYKGMMGYHVISENGNSIFLPVTGLSREGMKDINIVGSYRSRNLNPNDASQAYLLLLKRENNTIIGIDRDQGICIRPVLTK